MLKDDISRISADFLAEARKSPSLLEDMAAMEKYMAESYSGRTFIELLQNADDAGSTRVLFLESSDCAMFANNGRPFTSADLEAICRSGASTKARGEKIGYRGIGFKSAIQISKEILIYSNDACFSFSQSLCAKALGVEEGKVPTVRIPILIEDVPEEVKARIEGLLGEGYTTVFVFKRPNLLRLSEELEDADSGLFIFLNCIAECKIDAYGFERLLSIKRIEKQGDRHIVLEKDGTSSEWMIASSKGVSVAFQVKDGIVAPCSPEEATYHCFLPTIEPVCYPCKINADFSTDPSRKHITFDECSETALKIGASLLFETLRKALKRPSSKKFTRLPGMLKDPSSFSKLNINLSGFLCKLLEESEWLELQNGKSVSAAEYKCFPRDYDVSEAAALRKLSDPIREESLPSDVYECIECADEFLRRFSKKTFSDAELTHVAEDGGFMAVAETPLQSKVVSDAIRAAKRESALSGQKRDLSHILLPTRDGELATVEEIAKKQLSVSEKMVLNLSEKLMPSEVSWLKSEAGLSEKSMPSTKNDDVQENTKTIVPDYSKIKTQSCKPHISKWRDAEQKCLAIEESFGNKAKDVSLRNEGYDIVSTTSDGEKRYIEVKSVKRDWSFSLTNNEYTSASLYKSEYYVCLLCENEETLLVKYIRDPLRNAKFEKRIRQWEWACCEFSAIDYNFETE